MEDAVHFIDIRLTLSRLIHPHTEAKGKHYMVQSGEDPDFLHHLVDFLVFLFLNDFASDLPV